MRPCFFHIPTTGRIYAAPTKTAPPRSRQTLVQQVLFNNPEKVGLQARGAFARIWRYRACVRAGQDGARELGGVPMDPGRMDLERRKRTDPAARVRPAADPAFSARGEFLKNTRNIDKLTGFFDKFLNMQVIVIKRVIIQILASRTQIWRKKKFSADPRISPQQPAFARGASRRQSLIHQSALTLAIARIPALARHGTRY